MIPKEIGREHILRAIEHIDSHDVPQGRGSHKFLLRHGGKQYPPKYVVSLAYQLAMGKRLRSDEFGGGTETNGFLAGIGFEVVDRAGSTAISVKSLRTAPPKAEAKLKAATGVRLRRLTGSRAATRTSGHDGRCPACKRHVLKLLARLYGGVQEGKRFDIPAPIEVLLKQHDLPLLGRIHNALALLRGHKDFVGREHLPQCDYFVPEPGFVLEFDEAQHFTTARKRTLEFYGAEVPAGFDVSRWIALCERIDAHDDHPIDRDETRAWYDTLRDFLPLLTEGLHPTIRVFADERRWCKLDPDNREGRALFRDWLALPSRFEVEYQSEGNGEPFWGRVIIRGPWYGGVPQARRLLDAVCDRWPQGHRTRILVTSGGFASFDWPASITRTEVGNNLYPHPDAVVALFTEGEKVLGSLLSGGLRSKLLQYTDAIAIGPDSFKTQVSTTSECIRDLHAELVYFVDLRSNRIHRTGKTYPTVGQEDGLVRIVDVSSHFASFDGDSVLLLGCHDLNAFSPRGNSKVKRRWRRDIIRELHQAVTRRAPRIVVHHPHTTHSPRVWRGAWGELEATAGSVELYASAGRYHSSDGGVRRELGEVLRSTVRGPSLDFIATVTPM